MVFNNGVSEGECARVRPTRHTRLWRVGGLVGCGYVWAACAGPCVEGGMCVCVFGGGEGGLGGVVLWPSPVTSRTAKGLFSALGESIVGASASVRVRAKLIFFL